uniref:protein-tyrosine-phosphatase n=1 Tax=Ciona savignyi TaxID=51511 RepID=H2YN06_CIOSA
MNYHGDMQITTIDEIKQDCYIIRDMQITKQGQGTRIVRQFHFLTWPDHGSPLTTSGFMRFYDIIKETKTIHPIVVHCSAGVGRTGTFIAFDVLSDSMATTGIVDVYGTVVAMRRCRTAMVQSLDQYIYLYKLLVETTVLENRGFYASEIGQVMARLNTKNHIGKSLLQSEYEDLHLIEAINTKCIAANLANPKLNRDGTVLP